MRQRCRAMAAWQATPKATGGKPVGGKADKDELKVAVGEGGAAAPAVAVALIAVVSVEAAVAVFASSSR